MQPSDGDHPIALGACAANRVGFYEYAYRFECVESASSPGTYSVELVYYQGSSSCSDSDHPDRYIVEYYDPTNITIVCDNSNCNHGIRSYQDCTFKNEYTTTPVVWNLCRPLYQDPDNYHDYGYDVNNATWAQHMSYKLSCIDYEYTDDQSFSLPVWYGFLNRGCSTAEQYVGYPAYYSLSGNYYFDAVYNDDSERYCANNEYIGC